MVFLLTLSMLFAVVRQFLTTNSHIGGVQSGTTGLTSWKDTSDKNIWYTNYAASPAPAFAATSAFTMVQSSGQWTSATDAAAAYICQAPAT